MHAHHSLSRRRWRFLVAAPYSFDRLVHFILLGLPWGSAWLYMALTGYRHVTVDAAASAPRSWAVV